MFNIEEELKKLPAKPGVYIMRDKYDNIIYVGKAVVLKNRVRSYFRKTNKTERIKKMVSLIDHFEYIVVDNEAEALILECNLIKKNRPKFNVLLKDDKTYPYIKIDVKSDFPNVFITRRLVKDGSKYFGPYANPGSAKEMLDFIKRKYLIRQCRNFKSNTSGSGEPCQPFRHNLVSDALSEPTKWKPTAIPPFAWTVWDFVTETLRKPLEMWSTTPLFDRWGDLDPHHNWRLQWTDTWPQTLISRLWTS